MILEAAMLQVKPGSEGTFEEAFRRASGIMVGMDGYVSHGLQRCVEVDGKYLLLVRWRTLEDHTVGFRSSAGYQEWRALLHHVSDPFPIVEHFEEDGLRPTGDEQGSEQVVGG